MQASTHPEALQLPILLIARKGTQNIRIIFEAIRTARPSRLYIAAESQPRLSSSGEEQESLLELTKSAHLRCKIKTFFWGATLESQTATSLALTWFFRNEEEGIILEDNCVPAQSFYWYCKELIQRFRYDSRVTYIGGNNFSNDWKNGETYSYFFSKSIPALGWASWRRAWKDLILNTENPNKPINSIFNNFTLSLRDKTNQSINADSTVNGKSSSNYQERYTPSLHSKLTIVPHVNLIREITSTESLPMYCGTPDQLRPSVREIDLPLIHPLFVDWDKGTDKQYFRSLMRHTIASRLKHDYLKSASSAISEYQQSIKSIAI